MHSLLKFRGTSCFQKQLGRLGDIVACFLNGFALTDDVQFRAQRDETLF